MIKSYLIVYYIINTCTVILSAFLGHDGMLIYKRRHSLPLSIDSDDVPHASGAQTVTGLHYLLINVKKTFSLKQSVKYHFVKIRGKEDQLLLQIDVDPKIGQTYAIRLSLSGRIFSLFVLFHLQKPIEITMSTADVTQPTCCLCLVVSSSFCHITDTYFSFKIY